MMHLFYPCRHTLNCVPYKNMSESAQSYCVLMGSHIFTCLTQVCAYKGRTMHGTLQQSLTVYPLVASHFIIHFKMMQA